VTTRPRHDADAETDTVGPELAVLLGPRGPLERTGDDAAALPSDLDRVLVAERGVVAWLRSRTTAQRVLLAVALVLLWVGVVLVVTRRPDLGVLPTTRLLLDLVLLAAPLPVAVFVALRPLHRPPLPTWVHALVLAAGALGLVVFASLPMAHHHHPASLVGVGDDFLRRAIACFAFGSIFGALTLVGLRVLSRGSGRLLVPTIAVAVGSALAGALALYFHCPITQPLHLLAGHTTVLLPPLALAVVLGRRASDG
jgi:hypothetical protein